MGRIKFRCARLLPKYVLFACFVLAFALSGNCSIAQESPIKSTWLSIDGQTKLSLISFTSTFQINKILLAGSGSDRTFDQGDSLQETQDKEALDQTDTSSSKKVKKKRKNTVLGIFLSDSEIYSEKKQLIEYGNKHLPAKLRPVYNTIVEKSFEYPIILVFILLVQFFIVNILIVFVVLENTIKRKNYKERFERIYSKMYEEVLLAYMFDSIDWDSVLIKLKRHNRKPNRKILISVLMNFKSNFKGEMEHFIPEIYTKLSLHNDSQKSTNSYYKHKKVRGIIELIHLYPEGAKGIVEKLINDPNDYVRAEAQTAYIRLNPETPFNFFYNLERPFTRWTQLSAFNLIRLHQLPIPSFGQFLNFEHNNIRNFSLRMITFFQQLETAPEVVKMTENEMEQTRYLAYKAINDLRLYDSREMIKSKYESETLKNRLEIIKALRNIGVKEDFDFLIGIMKTAPVSFKTEACRSMYYMSTESREKLMQLDNNAVPEIELLIAHVTDTRS